MSDVRYHREGPVVWVTIEREAASNTLNASVRSGLLEAFERFHVDSAAVSSERSTESRTGEGSCRRNRWNFPLTHLAREEPLSRTYQRAEELYRPVYLSPDAQDGPRAFKEKRGPVWTAGQEG